MFSFIKPTEIRPKGWLYNQLRIQANGLSGHLDKMWPDISDSAWIGGSHEGWERVPYWLDGFIPMAYQLDDEDLKARAEKYIQAILKGQAEDGWICPCPPEKRAGYDLWAAFLIGKVLAVYCSYTGSRKAYNALYRSMKCLYGILKDTDVKLNSWGKARWFECLVPLRYIQLKKKEEWIVDFARLLKAQGLDYDAETEKWKRPINQWTFETHIVNLGMMPKYEELYCAVTGEKPQGLAEKHFGILTKYNGTAVGTCTGDECLSGLDNIQGTELCSVAEFMYSCEWLTALTGKRVWADRLEKAAFNAFPATNSDDMWTHQYDQQVNQIACVRFPGRSVFRTNGSEAHLFGLEPNYGCCTANFNQAWPKFAMSVFMTCRGGIVNISPVPARLDTKIKGVKVSIETVSDYPFRLGASYIIKTEAPVSFDFRFRVPKWAKGLKVNGKSAEVTDFYSINKEWNGTETITVEFEDEPHFVSRPNGLKVVEYGPLVFALPLMAEPHKQEYERNGVERKFPYCDYELTSPDEWRYGFAADPEFRVELRDGDSIPFSSLYPKIAITAKMARVNWNYADGFTTVAAPMPVSSKAIGEKEEKILIPYGCAKLRVTEMPLTRKK